MGLKIEIFYGFISTMRYMNLMAVLSFKFETHVTALRNQYVISGNIRLHSDNYPARK